MLAGDIIATRSCSFCLSGDIVAISSCSILFMQEKFFISEEIHDSKFTLFGTDGP